MLRTHSYSALCLVIFVSLAVMGQTTSKPNDSRDRDKVERELRQFYDAYAEDLRQHHTEAIANRYDARGYFGLGNGNKRFVAFEDNKKNYMTRWTGPKKFEWRDLSFEVLSPTSAAVVGLFDWTGSGGGTDTGSYTAVLTKQSGQWRIRVEDESFNSTGYSTKVLSGDRSTPGPYKYSVTAQAGSSIAAHRHPNDVRMTIKSGRLFILMGDLETAKVQRFDAGSTLVVPANTWHVEWWETETVIEAETMAPTRTERATPATPRVP
ncbi:MAG TPA: cupin domain-containing protein [Pyrinomonadaceae bacterium]